MPSYSTMFVYVISALTLASANPVRRATCNPNFEGVGVSVINGDREWTVEADAAGVNVVPTTTVAGTSQFRFEQSGQFPTSYIIKDVNNNELAVGVTNRNVVQLKTLTSSDPTQIWDVVCSTCSSDISQVHGTVATGCIITDNSGFCVETPEDDSDPFFVNICNGEVSQTFDFQTV